MLCVRFDTLLLSSSIGRCVCIGLKVSTAMLSEPTSYSSVVISPSSSSVISARGFGTPLTRSQSQGSECREPDLPMTMTPSPGVLTIESEGGAVLGG
jgi:hypothetical protein